MNLQESAVEQKRASKLSPKECEQDELYLGLQKTGESTSYEKSGFFSHFLP